MVNLPLSWTTSCPVGSEWVQLFSFPTTNISTYTWEFVLRTSPQQTGTSAAKVTQTAGSSGYITVDTVNSKVTVVLSPTATGALTPGSAYALALWSDPGLTDAQCWVRGTFTALPVAQP